MNDIAKLMNFPDFGQLYLPRDGEPTMELCSHACPDYVVPIQRRHKRLYTMKSSKYLCYHKSFQKESYWAVLKK